MTSLSGGVRRLEELGVDRSPDCNEYLQALRDLAGFELNVIGTAEDALKHAQRALEIEQERGLQRSRHHDLGHEMLARIKMKLNFDRKSVLHHARSAVKIVDDEQEAHGHLPRHACRGAALQAFIARLCGAQGQTQRQRPQPVLAAAV